MRIWTQHLYDDHRPGRRDAWAERHLDALEFRDLIRDGFGSGWTRPCGAMCTRRDAKDGNWCTVPSCTSWAE